MSDTPHRERLRCPECLGVFRSKFTFCPQDGSALAACDGEPLLGATIAERYVIEEVIGEGAMGMVYRARHVRLPRSFAVKVLFGDLASDGVMRLRFAQEAAAASQLSHPNLVPVVDFGKSERGLLYLIMDFVEGETLADLIHREAPLDPLRVMEITRAMALGLSHAHAHGLVHRDFKPDNVLMEHREAAAPIPRILDFGLAISAREDLDARITQDGYVVGTPVYISPEQARDMPIDHRADLFALGVVMYEMLAGRPPFDGPAMDVAHKNLAEPMPRIALRNPRVSVPWELEAVVTRLVAKSPAERYQSAEELLAELDRVEKALAPAPPTLLDLPRAAVVPLRMAETGWDDPREDDERLAPEIGRRGRTMAALAVVAAACVVAYSLLSRDDAAEHQVAKVAEVTEADRPVEPVASAPGEDPKPDPAPTATPTATPTPHPGPSTSTSTSTSTGTITSTARTSPRIFGGKAPPRVRRQPPAPSAPPEPAGESDRIDALTRAAGIRDAEAEPEPASSEEPAAAEPTPAAAPRPEPEPAAQASVARLVKDYRDVGNALVSLQERLGSGDAQPYRNRYFQVPYADALRIPAVRRDALAQLSALRHDIRRALRR